MLSSLTIFPLLEKIDCLNYRMLLRRYLRSSGKFSLIITPWQRTKKQRGKYGYQGFKYFFQTCRGQKFHSFARNNEWNLEKTSNSSQSTRPTGVLGKNYSGKSYYSLMFFIAYAFKGQVRVFAWQVKIVSHSPCRTSAILKYFCPLTC